MKLRTKQPTKPFEESFPAMARQLGITGDTQISAESGEAPYFDAIERVCQRLEELEARIADLEQR